VVQTAESVPERGEKLGIRAGDHTALSKETTS